MEIRAFEGNLKGLPALEDWAFEFPLRSSLVAPEEKGAFSVPIVTSRSKAGILAALAHPN